MILNRIELKHIITNLNYAKQKSKLIKLLIHEFIEDPQKSNIVYKLKNYLIMKRVEKDYEEKLKDIGEELKEMENNEVNKIN